MIIKKYFILLFVVLICINPQNAQTPQNPFALFTFTFEGKPYEDSIDIQSFAGIGRDSSRQITIHTLLTQPKALTWQKNPNKINRHDYYWICFRLINTTKDTLKRFVWLPFSFDYIKSYKIKNNTLVASTIRGRLSPLSIKNAICLQKTFYIELPPQSQEDYYFNYYSLIKDNYPDSVFLFDQTRLFETHQRTLDHVEYDIKFNIFLFTFLIILILSTFIQYYIFPRNSAFLYYIGYLFFIGLYYLNKDIIHHRSMPTIDFLRPHFYLLDILFSYGCYAFYSFFIIKFSDAGKNYPLLIKWMHLFSVFLILLIPIHYVIMNYGSIAANHYLFIAVRVGILILSFNFFFKYGTNTFNTFIYIGTAFLLLFILRGSIETISELLGLYPNNWLIQVAKKHRFIGIKLGVIVESIFFFIGLIFKGKQLAKEQYLKELGLQKQYIEQLEISQKWQLKYQTELEQEIAVKATQLLNLEKKQAIDQTRRQIAQDIHDEVGMHLTKIILTAELATISTNDSLIKKPFLSTRIAHEARQVVSKLKEIIFIISTEQSTFYELQAYIREKTNEFWKDTNIVVQFDFPNNEHVKKDIPIEMKRHLLMIFRESQNNIAKHAQATEVLLTLKIIDTNRYIFSIKDNGKGFNIEEKSAFSRGLYGINKRSESIGASATIESVVGKGTLVEILGVF